MGGSEFTNKRYVWVPDKDAGYISAWIVREEDGGEICVCSLPDGQMRSVPTDDLSKMNPPKFDKVNDIADLTFLNEASVVHNLRQRFFSGLIYTYSGLFLVAVNPYHSLPIYTDAIVASYKGRRREENAPHVYALADGAMRNMLEGRENQSLLITGESGAGKTENTKKVIQYLAAVAVDPTGGLSASNSALNGTLTRSISSSRHIMDHLRGVEGLATKKLGLLERQILQANPILEAFGNAQTIRNNNSSRFGKFVRIEFTSGGAIAGANIDWYLLEKSRVTNRSDKERSFHIFYQLLRGADESLKSKLLLTSSPEDYDYLKATRKHVEGVDDASEWAALLEALSVVGFTSEEQNNIFRVIAAILQVGNIQLADDRSEQARITNTSQVEKVCHVLGLSEQELTTAFLRPKFKAGREWVTQSRTRRQVIDEMASLCKTLYEKTFSSIVDRINKALDRPTSKSTFIGVLDIAGFEIFESNSFEQLCINYTNEKLQQFFNHHMFVLEQEEYARESIDWDFVNFGLDLQPTIDLIESTSPIGILSCLDEECIMPKATDLTFTEKLNRSWASNKDGSAKDTAAEALAKEKGVAHGSTKFVAARFAQGFTIKHYAGNVEYRTDGWLDKNKDPLNDNLTRIMSESTDRFVASLFAEYAVDEDNLAALTSNAAPLSPPKRRMKRGAFRTVAQRHKEQLNSLMSQLQSTQPHFVRCIVPNSEKKPGKMDVPLVLEQLRCNGVLEGIRIARLGYPNRLLFTDFRNRYEVLTPGVIPKGYMDGRMACQKMVEALELDKSSFKVGLTKVFFKAGVLADMEEKRDRHLHDIFSRFQGACRMYTARRQVKKILNRAAAVRTIQRNARLYVELRQWPWWQMYSKLRPLLKTTRHDEELKRQKVELETTTALAEATRQTLAASELKCQGLEVALRDASKDAEASQRNLIGFEGRCQGLEDALVSSKQRCQEMEHALQEANKDAETSQRSLSGLETKCQGLEVALVASEKRSHGLEEQLNAIEQRCQSLEDALIDSEKRSQGMRDNLAGSKRKCEELEEALRESKSRAAASEESQRTLAATNHQTLASSNQKISDLESALRDANSKAEASQKTLIMSNQKYQDLEDALRKASSAADASQRTIKASEQKCKDLEAALGKGTEARSAFEQRCRGLEEDLRKAGKEMEASRQSLAASEQRCKELEADVRDGNERSQRKVTAAEQKCKGLEEALAGSQQKYREVEAALQKVRKEAEANQRTVTDAEQRSKDSEASLREASKEAEASKQALIGSKQKSQELEDALRECENSLSLWMSKAEEVEAQVVIREQEAAALKQEVDSTQAELKKTQSMTKKTIVEHVHVLEEAKKYTDRQLQDTQRKLQELAQYTKTLEKSKARLVNENEDLSRENNRLQLESRGSTRGILTPAHNVTPGLTHHSGADLKTIKSLEAKAQELSTLLTAARRERDEAQSNYRRNDLQMAESLSRSKQQYESRIAVLEKELRGTQVARSTTYQILTDLVDKSNNGDDNIFRQKLLRELQTGHDELEQDIAAKAELLRNYQMNGSSPTLAARFSSKPAMSPFAKVAPSSPSKRASNGFSLANGVVGHDELNKEKRVEAERKADELQAQLNALVVQGQIMNEILQGA